MIGPAKDPFFLRTLERDQLSLRRSAWAAELRLGRGSGWPSSRDHLGFTAIRSDHAISSGLRRGAERP